MPEISYCLNFRCTCSGTDSFGPGKKQFWESHELNRGSRGGIVVEDIGILTSQHGETLPNISSIILRPRKGHTIGIRLFCLYGKVFE